MSCVHCNTIVRFGLAVECSYCGEKQTKEDVLCKLKNIALEAIERVPKGGICGRVVFYNVIRSDMTKFFFFVDEPHIPDEKTYHIMIGIDHSIPFEDMLSILIIKLTKELDYYNSWEEEEDE